MNSPQPLKEKIIKGSVFVLVMTFIGSFCAYLIRVLFSRTLTVENYGLFYAALSLFGIAITYMDLGFGYSIVYLLPKYIKSKNYSKAWNVFVHGLAASLVMSVIISFVLIILAPFLAKNYFKIAGSENLIYILCLYLISTTILNGLLQIYTGLQKEKYYSSINVLKWLLIFVFSFLIFLFDLPNVLFYALAWSLAHLVIVGIFVYLLYRRHQFLTNNKIIWQSQTLKTMWGFALPALLESMIYSLTIATDTSFLTFFRGVKEAGIYNIIYPIASISIMLLNPINNLILPLVSHLMEGEKDKLTYLVNKVLEIIPFAGLYFALFIIMFPSSIVALIFGTKWSGLVETPLMIISLGCIGLLLSIVLGTILVGTGKIRERLKIFTFIGIFHVIFNAISVWKFGVMGVVIANSLLGLLLSVMFLMVIKGAISLEVPYRLYLKFGVFSFVLFILVRFAKIDPHTWFDFITLSLLYTLIYASFGYFLKMYDKKVILMFFDKSSSKQT